MLAVNTLGPLLLARAALPHMLARQRREAPPPGGLLVNIGSAMGLAGAAGLVSYCASKHALIGMHEALRLELGRQRMPPASSSSSHSPSSDPGHGGGVHTMLVCPWHIIDTPMFGDSIHPTGTLEQCRHGVVTRGLLQLADLVRPYLLPPLTSAALAAQIVDACARAECGGEAPPEVMVVPSVLGWLVPLLRAVLPVRWMDVVLGIGGGWHGMDRHRSHST